MRVIEGAAGQVYRIDRGRVAKGKRTDQGFVVAEGTLAVSTVLKYRNPDGSIRSEYVPPSELEREDSLATLTNVPYTLGHPPRDEMVGPENVRELQRGIVHSPRYDAEGKALRASFLLQDQAAIEAHERGDVGLSAGYFCTLERKDGVSPDGEPYQYVQKNRRYNHVAGGLRDGMARAGARARMDGQLELGTADEPIARLDDAGNCVWPSNDPAATPVIRKDTTMLINIDGVDHEVANPTVHQAITKALSDRDKTIASQQSRIDALSAAEAKARTDSTTATSELQGKLDAEIAEHGKTKAALAEAKDPAKRAEEAAAVAKLDGDCKRLAPTAKLDGLDDHGKRRAALAGAKVACPTDDELKAKGLDAKTYVISRFDAAVAALPARTEADRKVAGARAGAKRTDTDDETEVVDRQAPRVDAYTALRQRTALENANRPGQARAHEEV